MSPVSDHAHPAVPGPPPSAGHAHAGQGNRDSSEASDHAPHAHAAAPASPAAPGEPNVHAHGHAHDHEDPHDHPAPATRWGKVSHRLSDLVGGHSHDAADQVDRAMEATAEGRRALWISLAALLATAAVQSVIVLLSHSVALFGDAVHNLADALTAAPLLLAFWLGERPANTRYTYGYGRAEDLAGVAVVLVIAASSVVAALAAIQRLLHPATVHHLPAVALAAVVGFVGNELVARYRITVGRRIGSAALVADGLHARTDGLTSLAVLLGAAGVALGFPAADPLIGLVITVAILGVLRSAARAVLARLLDAVDPDLVADATTSVAGTPGVLAVSALRIRWIGHTLVGEADVTVDHRLSLTQAHSIAHDAESRLLDQLPRLSRMTVHASPDNVHGDQ